MNVTEIIIGRDTQTGKLRISQGQRFSIYRNENSVPNDISQNHIRIEVTDKGEMVLINLNAENVTYVNGLCIMRKQFTQNDKLELGYSRFCLSWETVLNPILPKFADIRPLEKVWNDYQNNTINFEIKCGRINSVRSIMMVVSPISGLASGVLGVLYYKEPQENTIGPSMVSCALLAIIGFVVLILSWRQASSVPKQKIAMKQKAQDLYRCPKCGYKLPLNDYIYLNYKNCPNPDCKAYFIS